MAATKVFKRTGEFLDRRFVWAGGATGLMGGVCCIGGAIAMATGLGALSFFSTLSDGYTPYFIAGSVALMLVWLARQTARFGFSRSGLVRAASTLGRQTAVMGVMYGVTLGLAIGSMQLAEAVT